MKVAENCQNLIEPPKGVHASVRKNMVCQITDTTIDQVREILWQEVMRVMQGRDRKVITVLVTTTDPGEVIDIKSLGIQDPPGV